MSERSTEFRESVVDLDRIVAADVLDVGAQFVVAPALAFLEQVLEALVDLVRQIESVQVEHIWLVHVAYVLI